MELVKDKVQSCKDLQLSDSKYVISREELKIAGLIEYGTFGEIWRGTFKGTIEVAIKTLRLEQSQDDFLAGSKVLQHLEHGNLIKLYGVVLQKPLSVVIEYASNGNLHKALSAKKITKLEDKVRIATQISSGMAYIASMEFVHRDLRAVCVYLDKGWTAKIGHFSQTRPTVKGICKLEQGKFPIKWTAPESLVYHIYCEKSDVWSFGVVLYEIFTDGAMPYADTLNKEVFSLISGGFRMSKPERCPQSIYEIMSKCWLAYDADRPTFAAIKVLLSEVSA